MVFYTLSRLKIIYYKCHIVVIRITVIWWITLESGVQYMDVRNIHLLSLVRSLFQNHLCWILVFNYNGIPISWTLSFPNLLMTQTKSCFHSSVNHCNFTPEPIFLSLGGSKNQDSSSVLVVWEFYILEKEIWILLCLIKDFHSPDSEWGWNLNPTFCCRNLLWKMSAAFLVTLSKYLGWMASHLQLMQTQKQF